MSDLLTNIELDGLRRDIDEMLGLEQLGPGEGAKTTIKVTRVLQADQGPLDPVTGKYTTAAPQTIIASTPAHIGPITFRRNRAEFVGGILIRVRQYRCIVRWDVGDILVGDFVEVLTSEDPDFIGRVMEVGDVLYESELAGRRLTLVDTTDDHSASNPNC